VGAPTYHWLRAQALAALGDYTSAEKECEMLADLETPRLPDRAEPLPAWMEMAAVVAGSLLDQQPLLGSTRQEQREELLVRARQSVVELARRLSQESKARTLRGLLALEEGEVGRATTSFRLALAIWTDDPSRGRIDFPGRVAAQTCLRWLLGE
jgi:hypothetical protein